MVSFINFSERAFSQIVAHSIEISKFDLLTRLFQLPHPHLTDRVICEKYHALAYVTEAELHREKCFYWGIGH